MSNVLDKIKERINLSDLSAEEKLEFSDILMTVEEGHLSPISTLFLEDLSWVRLLFDNYRAKKSAFANNDVEAAEKILKEEEAQLQQME